MVGTAASPGITGVATMAGELTNHTGYDLENVQIVVYGWSPTNPNPLSYLYMVDATAGKGDPVWKNEQKIDLAATVRPQGPIGTVRAPTLDGWLEKLAKEYAGGQGLIRGYGPRFDNEETNEVKDQGDDLLYVLLDARKPNLLTEAGRIEPVRGLTRGMDATKLLHAAGGLVIARAGDVTKKHYVPSPVPITVNGRQVKGQGDVLFVWALPISGQAGEAVLNAEGGGRPGRRPAAGRGAGGAAGPDDAGNP
jgi:hypothetical protein